jgi:hypothetical protein
VSAGARKLLRDLGVLGHDVRLIGRHAARRAGLARWAERSRTRGSPDAVFVHIPKSAGTSVTAGLERARGRQYLDVEAIRGQFPQQGIVTFGHLRYVDLLQEGIVSADFDRQAFVFSIVRNPFDRAVSLYEYLRHRAALPGQISFEIFSAILRDRCYEPIGLYNVRGLSQCNPQLAWLTDDDGKLIADQVGRFEELQDVAAELQSRKILLGPLPRANVTIDRRATDTYYGTPAVRRNVEEAYAVDFEAFGY